MSKNKTWEDFKLLLWKNFLLKFRHKVEFAIEIFVPLIFCFILVIIRYLVVPVTIKDPTIYDPVPVNSLEEFRENVPTNSIHLWEIDYAPKNQIFEEIIKNAAEYLQLQYRGFDNAKDVEKFILTNHSFAGVLFDSRLKNITSYPKDLKFTLRFPGALRTAHHFSEFSTWLTKHLFPTGHYHGPRNKNSSDGGLPPGYVREGFIALQYAISSSFINLAAKEKADLPDIVLRRFPYPPYVDDPLLMILESMAAVVVVLSFVYPVTQAVKYVTTEKETQLKEAMKIMGLSTALHWAAWYVTLWVCFMLTVVLIVIMIKIPWFQGFTAAVLTNTSWSLLLVFLSIYSAATVTFCFMVSSFFSKANVASAVAGLGWFVVYFPYDFTLNNFFGLPLSTKLGLSIFLNTALAFGFRIMLKWESVNAGSNWSNLFSTVTVEENMSLGYVMIMMLVDAIIFLLITIYMEKVMPGPNGVPMKWYFPFTRNFWCPMRIYSEHDGLNFARQNPDRFEPEVETDKKTGVHLINLRKKFGSRVAVDNLSMKMYEGHITVLLGHNGAGKTTTISMITGMLPPTSGTVVVRNLDIRRNLPEIRQNLGFCPQHNILFDELTVREHIIFYSRLKGFSEDQVEAEVGKYLKLLDFEDKRDALSKTLSGGMKRKLSVGVALCGNSKVVLFDEPTSGMDPAARRILWDLLLSEKKGRTILLTTHFMDEADVLGDRIFIMALGKLKCGGTPFFLKKKFGTGYQLICRKGDNCKPDKVTELLRKHIQDVELKSDVGKELSYQLPEKHVKKFEAMLKQLEERLQELDVDGYGISMTTLEDVFMRTGNELATELFENGEPPRPRNSLSIEYFPGKESLVQIQAHHSRVEIVGRITRMQYHWRAMFLKKYYYFLRNWYIYLIQLLVPLFFVGVTVYVSKSMAFKNGLPPLPITLESYGHTTTLLESSASNGPLSEAIGSAYERIFQPYNRKDLLVKIKVPILQQLIELQKAGLVTVDSHYMVGASISESQITGWFNNAALHTAPLSLNLIFNAIAKALLGNAYSIHITNNPLPYDVNYRLQMVKRAGSFGFQMALNLAFAMSFISAIFIMFLIKERESRAKLLQFVSGVRVITFWISHLLWDFATYVVLTILLIALLYVLQQEGFSTGKDLGRIFIVFTLYGFASLPFTYLVSFLYADPSTGLTRLSIYNVFTGNGLHLLIFVLTLPVVNFGKVAGYLAEGFLIFPNFALAQALSNQAALATTRNICDTAQELLKMPMHMVCTLILPDCCGLNEFGFNNPGIGRILVFLFGFGILCLIVLFAVEFFRIDVFKKLADLIWRPKVHMPPIPENEDDDVAHERRRISNKSVQNLQDSNIVMRDVTKYYGKLLAVNRVSLAIPRGECFGLLGTNGAGKTTTFKMLTGDANATFGDIWVGGNNAKHSMNTIYEMTGYCPQFDALFMDLTGRETLRIYSLLRGINIRSIDPLIHNLARELAFQHHLNKKVLEYSGGNRRKLSAAIAILGYPQVVYLDEPTAGIDPASRRKLWDLICFVRDLGKGIVLTSHSMEECEALCTRIAILVDGTIKCLGSPQHLKDKFSQGISLSIRLESMESQDGYYDENLSACPDIARPELGLGKYGRNVYNFIIQQFKGAILKDCHKNLLTFEIPSRIMPYSRIFGLMETNKKNLHIEDYSLSQTTLEQVFLDFAHKQRSKERRQQGKTKQANV